MSAETLKAFGMKDLSLFREQAYIAGNWSDADSGKKDEVLNPATGEVLGDGSAMRSAGNQKGHRSGESCYASLEGNPCQGAGENSAEMV